MKKTLILCLLTSLLLLSCKEKPVVKIMRIHGSNTIGAELMPAMVKNWLTDKGATEISVIDGVSPEEREVHALLNKQRISIEIHSYGSSTGFSDLKSESCDIGMSSKPIPEKNIKELSHLGDMRSYQNEHIIALDGIAIIVHPESELRSLDLETVKEIFSGAYTTWRELGVDSDDPIAVYRRDNNSGTHEVFNKLVMRKEKIVSNATVTLDNNELVTHVKSDPYAIGYASITFTGGTKALTITDKSGLESVPSVFTVQTEDYPLSRRLFLYTPAKVLNPYVDELLQYALSRKGQEVVDNVGFVSQTIKLEKPTEIVGAPKLYRNATEDALRFSMNFRFIPGSSRLDNRSFHDVKRLANFIESEKLDGCSLRLFGFTDNHGNSKANLALSYKRAKTVSNIIQEQTGIGIDAVKGFGEILPVASNTTIDGREKNRRVEVWLSCSSEG